MAGVTAYTTGQAKKRFLAAYAHTGVILHACRAANVGRTTYYEWTEQDPDFATAAGFALAEAGDRLEEHAIEWATVGVKTVKEVYERNDRGELVLTRREESRDISPTILIFALKGAKPEKYRERHDVNVTGSVVKAIDREFWEAV